MPGIIVPILVVLIAGSFAVLIYRLRQNRIQKELYGRLEVKLGLTPQEARERVEEAAEKSSVVVSEAAGLWRPAQWYSGQFTKGGLYSPYASPLYLAGKLFLVIVMALVPALVLGPSEWGPPERKILYVVGLVMTWFVPDLFLAIHIREWRLGLIRGLPEWLDLHATMVEGGMGFDAALARIVEETQDSKEPIYRELRLVQKEMLMGSDRLSALRRMGARTRLEELEQVVAALVQADRLGAGIISALRAQADMTRNKVWERARENAEKLSTKMLFPIFLGILPMFYVLTLWPLVLRVLDIFRGME